MRKRLLIILLAVLLALAGAALVMYLWIQSYVRTPKDGTGEVVAVDIPAGIGPRQTAELLFEKKVIRDSKYFYWYVRYWRRAAGKLKAGELAFRDNMSFEEALQVLQEGTPITHKITIPEGLRLDEIGKLCEQEGLAEAKAFERRARDSEFVKGLNLPGDSLEGFLYPETYSFRKHTPQDEILLTMVDQYKKVYTEEYRQKATDMGLSELEVVTLASIVEKETGAKAERSLIAGVFFNRIKRNWLLQTDPTVIYAVLLSRGSFNGNITKADLQMDHPYNTYRHKGLPPGPICSPGGEAIKAVLYPQPTDYMFFVSKNDGSHHFCRDLGCHNRAVNQFQRGGRSPSGTGAPSEP